MARSGHRARSRSIRVLVAAVGLAGVLAVAVACSGNESAGSSSTTLDDPDATQVTAPGVDCYKADKADPGGPITVSIGAQFAIVLAAEPSTGFSWQPTAPADPAMLLALGTEFRGPGEGCDVTSETQVLRYVGRAPGTTQISLHYSRPAASAPDDQVVTFTVNVVDPTTTTTPPPDTASTDTTSTTAPPRSTTTKRSTTTTRPRTTTTTRATATTPTT